MPGIFMFSECRGIQDDDLIQIFFFLQEIKGIGNKGDVLVGLSTSGNSKNIVTAFDTAKEKGMTTIAFTGSSGGKLKNNADFLINIPSDDTPRIQEAHITVGHIICQFVEEIYFKEK